MLFGFSLLVSLFVWRNCFERFPLVTSSTKIGVQSNPIRCPSRWPVPPRRGDQRKRARSSRRTEAFDAREGMAALSFGASDHGRPLSRKVVVVVVVSRRKTWMTSRDSSPKEKTATSRLKSRPVPVNGRRSGRTKPRTGRESSS